VETCLDASDGSVLLLGKGTVLKSLYGHFLNLTLYHVLARHLCLLYNSLFEAWVQYHCIKLPC